MQTRGYTYSIDAVTFRVTIYCFEGDVKVEEHSIGNKFNLNEAITCMEDAIDTAGKFIDDLKEKHAQAAAIAAAQQVQESIEVTQESVPSRTISKYKFYTKFTIDELEKLYSFSKDDVKLAVFVKILDSAEEIDLDNDILLTALQYMQSMDVITQERVNEILA